MLFPQPTANFVWSVFPEEATVEKNIMKSNKYFKFKISSLLDLLRQVISCLVWICISLTISEVEYLFIYVLTICISSLKKCLLKPLACFLFLKTILGQFQVCSKIEQKVQTFPVYLLPPSTHSTSTINSFTRIVLLLQLMNLH